MTGFLIGATLGGFIGFFFGLDTGDERTNRYWANQQPAPSFGKHVEHGDVA